MSISLVICSRNRPTLVRLLLSDIACQTMLPSEVVVAEDITDCQNLSLKIVKSFLPSVKKIYYGAGNFNSIPGIRNFAWKKTTGEIVISIDDDVRLPKKYIENAWYLYQKYPLASGFVGEVLPTSHSMYDTFLSAYFNGSIGLLKKMTLISAFPFSTISLKKNECEKYKLVFNELLETGEDIDFLLCLNEKGGRLYYNPVLVTYHDFRITNIFSFLRRFYVYSQDFAALSMLHPNTYLDAQNFLPGRKLHWLLLPIFIVCGSFYLARQFVNQVQLPRKHTWLAWLMYLAQWGGFLSSNKGRRLLLKDLQAVFWHEKKTD